MDDFDDHFPFDGLSGIDLTLWLRLILGVLGVTAVTVAAVVLLAG